MNNNNFFRITGWCAFAAALAMLGAVISFMLAPILGGILEYLFLLLLIVVFYGLYVTHRSESKGLSLTGLLLLLIAIVVDGISMSNYGNPTLSNLWYLAFSLPFLIFGFLGLRSPRLPRGLTVLALLTGGIYLVSGVGGFLAGPAFADNVSSVAILSVLAWLVWLWRVFLSAKFASTLPVATPA